MTFITIIIIIAILLAIYLVYLYNTLITNRNKVKNEWSQIEVQLQRRFDLIPNIVEAVKGYMTHEESILSQVAELRTSWASANSIQEKANLNNSLSSALKSIMAVAENYPDLKANQNFLELQNELKNTEDSIANSRQNYNTAATDYNTKLETFPSNLVASKLGFKPEELFKVDDESKKENVKISF